MTDDFAFVMGHVLNSEGGYVDDPKDPGGATNKGVTQHQYDLWRIAHGQPTRSVKLIDDNEVEAFYRGWYWNSVQADKLPPGVDYCVMDCAVNSGPHTAIEWLQQAVGVHVDGQLGPVTLAAVNHSDPKQLITGICAERMAFLQTRPTWSHFGRGWAARVAEVQGDAQGMA